MQVEFFSPQYLYALLGLIPLLLLALYRYYGIARQIRHSVEDSLWGVVIPERAWGKRLVKDILLLLALGAVLYALARPRVASSLPSEEDRRGMEVVLCVDVSNSMLSTDVAPSRLTFAKQSIMALLDQMTHDKVGIVIFAGKAFVQLPITTDLHTARQFVSDISTEMLSAQGTNIADAITLAMQSFSDRRDVGKSIIFFTDGEDHEDGVDEALAQAKEQNVRISVVGVGTEEGAPIPENGAYMLDPEGKMVLTRLNVEMCASISERGGGVFVASTSKSEVVGSLIKHLDTLPKAALDKLSGEGYIERYAPWLWFAFALLLLELLIMERKNRFWVRYNIFGHEE